MGDPKDVAREGWDAWFRGDVDAVVGGYTEDAEVILPAAPPLKGKAAIREGWKMFKAAFPDERPLEIRHLADGNTVISIFTTEATHSGPLPLPTGEMLPATGKKVIQRGVSVIEVEGDKAKQHTFYFDNLEFMQQLGLMPESAPTSASS